MDNIIKQKTSSSKNAWFNKGKNVKQVQSVYDGKYEIASIFTGNERQYVIDLLRSKSCT